MDTIFIQDLRVEARIGVYDWEKHLPQTVRLDLVIAAPSRQPFETGRIADALDYAKVVERLKAFAREAPPPLLERWIPNARDRARVLVDTPRDLFFRQ